MTKITAEYVQNLLNKINSPSAESSTQREKWIAELKVMLDTPERFENESTWSWAKETFRLFSQV